MDQMLEAAVGLVWAAALPGLASLAILLAVRFAIPPRRIAPWAYLLAFCVAYCLGHVLVAGAEFSLVPDRNWHWLFYLVPLAGIAGVMAAHPRSPRSIRYLLIAFVTVLSAWLLTMRPGLWAPRPALMVAMVGYLFVTYLVFEPLAARFSPASISAVFWLAATALAAMIAQQISLSDAEVVAAAAGALAGICISTFITRANQPAAALAFPVIVVLGGWAWKETLSEARLAPLLILPLVPIALWLSELKPVARLPVVAKIAVQLAAIFLLLGVVRLLLGSAAY